MLRTLYLATITNTTNITNRKKRKKGWKEGWMEGSDEHLTHVFYHIIFTFPFKLSRSPSLTNTLLRGMSVSGPGYLS